MNAPSTLIVVIELTGDVLMSKDHTLALAIMVIVVMVLLVQVSLY